MLIVIEGIDGSGKTTQARLLYDALRQLGYDTVLLSEPSDSEYGRRIRKKLQEGNYTAQELYDLFIKDRKAHAEKIASFLSKNKIVIMDRYYISTIAYQGAQGIQIARIIEDHKNLPQPDLIIILDIDPSTALQRLGREKDTFEKEKFLAKVRQIYLQIPQLLEQHVDAPKIYIINANKPIEKLHKEILSIVLTHISKQER